MAEEEEETEQALEARISKQVSETAGLTRVRKCLSDWVDRSQREEDDQLRRSGEPRVTPWRSNLRERDELRDAVRVLERENLTLRQRLSEHEASLRQRNLESLGSTPAESAAELYDGWRLATSERDSLQEENLLLRERLRSHLSASTLAKAIFPSDSDSELSASSAPNMIEGVGDEKDNELLQSSPLEHIDDSYHEEKQQIGTHWQSHNQPRDANEYLRGELEKLRSMTEEQRYTISHEQAVAQRERHQHEELRKTLDHERLQAQELQSELESVQSAWEDAQQSAAWARHELGEHKQALKNERYEREKLQARAESAEASLSCERDGIQEERQKHQELHEALESGRLRISELHTELESAQHAQRSAEDSSASSAGRELEEHKQALSSERSERKELKARAGAAEAWLSRKREGIQHEQSWTEELQMQLKDARRAQKSAEDETAFVRQELEKYKAFWEGQSRSQERQLWVGDAEREATYPRQALEHEHVHAQPELASARSTQQSAESSFAPTGHDLEEDKPALEGKRSERHALRTLTEAAESSLREECAPSQHRYELQEALEYKHLHADELRSELDAVRNAKIVDELEHLRQQLREAENANLIELDDVSGGCSISTDACGQYTTDAPAADVKRYVQLVLRQLGKQRENQQKLQAKLQEQSEEAKRLRQERDSEAIRANALSSENERLKCYETDSEKMQRLREALSHAEERLRECRMHHSPGQGKPDHFQQQMVAPPSMSRLSTAAARFPSKTSLLPIPSTKLQRGYSMSYSSIFD